ncbi:unnamed protein product (macronuclear) [Paramecium tetraurelia]|uniref:Beta/gamma crystallin 'Greek key' domain-containing protein n=1 Tax=Paramecium tetraurelia TaxID=5888 RepID=A0CND1_PARTE|nr:uncharacterized protein GSPATT00008740001 [Paramecium tetraurelia]CAK72298.1 unnamed protein product [Paramecium tetraurelia]|eukprot:XP_001439695.1 hypothetical protein (macronuclear) [Paramecium tetraurelia strain d4-2]
MKFIALAMLVMLATSQEFVEFYSAFQNSDAAQLDGWTIQGSLSKAQTDNFFTCSGASVFGGPKAFGKGAIVTKQFQLPPHFQIKIQVEVWKFDAWDTQRQFFYLDNYLWETMWTGSDGTKRCATPAGGNVNSFPVDQTITHNHAALFIAFTSSADKTADKMSWGFRNLKLSYLPCPTECGTCLGPDAIVCQMWVPVSSSWIKNVDADGWSAKGSSTVIKSSTCAGVPIIGGPGNFGNNVSIQKIFDKLVPHYRIKVIAQFWKIDNWDNDNAVLSIDNQEKWKQNVAQVEDKEYFICDKISPGGVDGTEKIINVNFETPHNYGAALVKWTSTIKKSSKQASWGIRQFQLYVAQCSSNCATCTGPSVEDCYCLCFSLCIIGSRRWKWIWLCIERRLGAGWTANADWKILQHNVENSNSLVVLIRLEKMLKSLENSIYLLIKELELHLKLGRLIIGMEKIILLKLMDQMFGKEHLDLVILDLLIFVGGDGFENYAIVDFVIGHETPTLDLLISTTIGKNNDNASFALKGFKLYYEKPDACATLYTECNYTGKSFNMCEDLPNFQLAKYPSKIKSIQVPAGAKVILFDEMDYNGKTIEYTENQKCIEEYQYKFLQKNQQSIVLTANN